MWMTARPTVSTWGSDARWYVLNYFSTGVGPIFTTVGHDQDNLQQGSGDKRVTCWRTAEAKVGCDQATGREAPKPRRLWLDLQMTAEPQPELIHTRRGSRTGTRKARTSRFQRDLFTSPGRTRVWVNTRQIGCNITGIYQIIKSSFQVA